MGSMETALEELNSFWSSLVAPIPWKLETSRVLERLRAIVEKPDVIDQRMLNACGPAVFFRLWFAHDPVSAVRFACGLLRHGYAAIGNVMVSPRRSLVEQDYEALRSQADADYYHATPEAADWMLLSSLRDSENLLIPYLGRPRTTQDAVAGLTLPGTLIGWLTATGVFSGIFDETSVFSPKGRPEDRQQLLNLAPSPSRESVLFVHSAGINPLMTSPEGSAPDPGISPWPNHYGLLAGPFAQWDDPAWLEVDCWSWGRIQRGWQGANRFFAHYYGTMTLYVRPDL